MADNRARAAISIEHICKSWTPRNDELTMDRVAEDFRNLSVSSDQFEDRTETIVNPQFTEWLKQAFELRIDRLRKPYDNAVKNEFIESNVDSRILSLGVAPILAEELKDQIQEFEDTHESLKHVPDHMQLARLAVYTSNLASMSGSMSSTVSQDRTVKAIDARRTDVDATTIAAEVQRRHRRLLSHRSNRKSRLAIEKELDSARLMMIDGADTFSKFRSCCNHFSTL